MAFLYIFFGPGGDPVIDFANVFLFSLSKLRVLIPERRQTCSAWNGDTFPGTNLADCSFLASDIQQCQSKGKIVTLSIGGQSFTLTSYSVVVYKSL